jgi:hypothetical protein
MSFELPSPIAAFFHAHNTGQTKDFHTLFTADAVVSDEEQAHHGPAIKEWIDKAIAKYKPQAEITRLTPDGDKTVVTAQVSGTFPGSPAQLNYEFTLRDGKIAALNIRT